MSETLRSSKPCRVPFNDLRPALAFERIEIDEAIARVISSGNLILGPECAAFERTFADSLWYRHAIGVANGTDAIELALRALVEGGSDVLTVANSAPATVAAIIRAGMNPVFCEVGPDGLINAQMLGHFMTPNTKAIVPVCLYGRYYDRKAVMAFANEFNLAVIEDAAQAFGTILPDAEKPHASCYSFYPTKSLGALGDGGAVVTNLDWVDAKIRTIRFYGIPESNRRSLMQTLMGGNSRLDELQAAILHERIGYVGHHVEERRKVAKFYYDHLPSSVMPRGWDATLNYHLFTINVENRDEFRAYLEHEGIQTAVHYPIPAHRQLPTEQRHRVLPITQSFCMTTLSLPCWSGMNQGMATDVVEAVNGALDWSKTK